MTRQGSRLDASLYACTLYGLDCDPKKIEVKQGAYRQTDYMGRDARMAAAPTELAPAVWRRARKTETLAPQRNESPVSGTVAVQKSARAACD